MGLIGGMARTAVVAGTATAVSNRVSRRQAGRWAANDAYEQQQYAAAAPPPQQVVYAQAPPAPAPAPADDGDDMIEKLQKLGQLHQSGVLTDAEFEAQKARLLNS